MKRRYVPAVLASIFFLTVAGALFAQNTNTELGTWKLNVAKSTPSPGLPMPKSLTSKFEAAGAGRKGTVDSVQADGTKTHWESTANYDGKDNPISGNNPLADTISITRINSTTTQTIYKKNSKVTSTLTLVVSADMKLLTITIKGVNAAGEPVNNVMVYDRQ